MPTLVRGETGNFVANLQQVNYEYEYPDNLKLKPGSEFHEALKTKVLDRARISHKAMSARFDSWNKVDHILTAYIPSDQEERDMQAKDSRRPISIVFPYSYAMMESLLSYLMAAFTQDPIFRYEGVSPEDTLGAMLLELVIQTHCNKTKVPLALHTWFRDSMAYGMGIVSPSWMVRKGTRSLYNPGRVYDAGGQLFNEQGYRSSLETTLFEGNEISNIDPYRYFPDPSVSSHEVQKGEFVGWLVTDNLMNLLRTEQSDEDMFNARYLRHVRISKSEFSTDHSERTRKSRRGKDYVEGHAEKNRVDLLYMYIDLIPEDWDLGDSEYPERWCFCIANDSVIVKAYKTNFNHGMFPVAVAAPDFDGYTSTPMSKLEILYGLQGVLDFLFNSHIANVRKAVNDMIIVDPQQVNINDLKDPKPGKLIRLRRPAWGRGVKDVAMQLGITDVTRGNIADSSFIVQWMQKIAAVDDPVMGSLRSGGPDRLTKGEFQGTERGMYSRLARVASIIGFQGMTDIGYQFATNSQQMMDEETYVRVLGRWKETLLAEYGHHVQQGRMKVNPNDLLIEYDVFVRDGSIPGSNFSEAWLQLYGILAQSPELMQQFDMVRIFMHIARSMGAKNVEEFKRQPGEVQPTVMSDEAVGREAERGNLVPLEV